MQENLFDVCHIVLFGLQVKQLGTEIITFVMLLLRKSQRTLTLIWQRINDQDKL